MRRARLTKTRFALACAALILLLPTAFSRAAGNAADDAASAEPIYATVGAVGDIIVMDGQSAGAYDDATGTYDFTRSFAGMADCLSSVDLMCGNLEVPLAGEKFGYAQRQRNPGEYQTFNAPDALADALAGAGFDVLTTANNHCLDCGAEGLYRTIRVLDAKGIRHTGTAASAAGRNKPLVVDAGGIRVGIVAATEYTNDNLGSLSKPEQSYAVTTLYKHRDLLLADIAACRKSGAEFVIVFPHWGQEKAAEPKPLSRRCAAELIAAGADAVLGAHSHCVQEAEYITVQRGGKPHTGLVVYSMGNFISNMLDEPYKYGLFVRLTLKKDAGVVTLSRADCLPTLTFARRSEYKRSAYEVIPALSDPENIESYSPLSETELRFIQKARAYVEKAVRADVLPLMEDLCWKN